jgi:hypothetical protein
LTPSHSFSSSSIRGSKNKSKSFHTEVGLGISRDIKQLDGLTHFDGGRFRGVTRIGHILYAELKLPNGLKPSVATASLKFFALSAKVVCVLSKCFHASSFAGWLNTLRTFSHLFLCHSASSVVHHEAKILYNLFISGKCLKTL